MTTLKPSELQTKLTREQKEAVGLLSIGTFLEYFDLMLYVHMAVLLNELFFPKTDPHVKSLLYAFSFCSTYLLRPFGAMIFGYIGDTYGRKFTVIITTFLMSISCCVMAFAPTYEEVGITASITITLCRMLQGISSMGEKIGAEIYLTETFKPPLQYSIVASIPTFSAIGTMCALTIASIMTSNGFNWRYAFGIGAIVAVIGFIARSSLRESIDFADAQRRVKALMIEFNRDEKKIENNPIVQEKINKKTAIAFFLMQCAHPVWLYVVYIWGAHILKDSFGFTAAEVIQRNLIISVVELATCVFLTYLSFKIYPLKILRFFSTVTFIGMIFACFFINYITSNSLLCFQLFIATCAPSTMPGTPIFLKHFPVFKRFTSASLLYAISRAFMYVVTSFGLVYLVEWFGYIGILAAAIPVLIGHAWGLSHFQKLDTKDVNYPQSISSHYNKSTLYR